MVSLWVSVGESVGELTLFYQRYLKAGGMHLPAEVHRLGELKVFLLQLPQRIIP